MKPAFAVLLCVLVLGPAVAWSQAPFGRIVRPNAVWHTVADLDRSVAFYRDAVGLSVADGPRPLDGAAGIGAAGASMRAATLSIPGGDVRLTLVQFSGIAAPPVHQRLQDPGSVKLVVRVRDMDAAFSRVRPRIERVYTEGGAPMKPEGPAAINTAVIMRDPDGYPLEFALQGTPPIAAGVPAGSNVVGGWATFIVVDAAATAAFYRTRLDFQSVSEARPLTPAALILQGTPTAAGMSAGHRPPGAATTWRLYEFQNVERTRLSPRLQDPGATAVSFWVDDVPALLARLKAAGGPPAEIGPVRFDGRTRAFVRDPNGLLLEFVESGATGR